ncbi:phosphotransferase family protein [Cryptosporangium arvum]|uniref:Putative aminoglycoside phosphotransferase n=1 Tax=Cryptosporangium arvum DSM 44712 TaxID=927661 RepID=A0A010YGH3_9ACTN|nr:phosphotransferase family protein [Cryptosporangium arvum]EXG79340.1 putative aminoglycoside phosphotransferase [Cryptosporangium arvum DSM 44712]
MAAVPGVEVSSLEAYLRKRLPGLLAGPLSVELVAGGRSNLTYLLSDGVGRWVLRRPPLGHVLETAHDMGREYRLLSALHPTDVPVPEPLLLGDAEVIGAPFYVMTFAEGAVLRTRDQLEAFDPVRAAAVADGLIDVLARLHRLDPAAVGLGELGRPVGYLERQLRRWSRQLEASRTRELPELDRLHERLAAELPEHQGAAIVHGDYRLDNVVVDAGTGAVNAVLDWEMATLGDPLTDLASTVMWWDGMQGLDIPVAALPGDVPAFPSGAHLVESYQKLTGADLGDLPWYLGFAHYKMAAIFEGIHYRSLQGMTVGEGFDLLGPLVAPLAERGHDALTG